MAVQDRFDEEEIKSEVRKHYGSMASQQPDVQGTSCCSPKTDSTSLIYEVPEVRELPSEVRSLSAGCGDPITLAELQPGETVLDLGSGGGIDCFLAAQKVGNSGRVIGVDMTAEMLSRARANKQKVGAENVEFRLGEIEHLPVEDNSVDVIISNCVINLSPDKPQVFREAYRVLRSGGKLAVSDILADGPLPEQLEGDVASWACCIGGAIDQREYIQELEAAGFVDIRIEAQNLNEDLIVEFMGEERVERSEGGEQKPMIHVNGEWIPLKLGDRKPPFSARITARKP